MENSEKVEITSHLTKEKYCDTNNHKSGVNNWTIVFLAIFCSNFIIENYMSYGIIKNPIELTFDFFEFMETNWWCYVVLLLGFIIQIILCFFNEKLLAVGYLPEQLGMALHVFISLFLFNLWSVLCLTCKLNPVAGIIGMAHVFLMSVKFWRYAYTNKQHRKVYKKNISAQFLDTNGKANPKDKETVTETIKYPDNVTLKNVFQFMVYTGSGIYKISGVSRKQRNFKKAIRMFFCAVLIYYTAAFLAYQYVLPELNKAVLYINTEQYLNVFGSVLKLALPVNMVWIFYFYFYCFVFYVPVFGWICGTEDVLCARDWWNSENTSVFWTKWNYQVHIWLKECFFIPLLQVGYSKRTAALVVGCVSGVLHEYLITIPCRGGYGLPTLAMLAQIPLANMTTFVQIKFGDKWGNLLVWLSLVFGQTVCLIVLCYNYVKSQ